ncbi:MAG: nitroreductase family protein [Wujia sp.]
MEAIECIKNRRSVRRFTDDEISDETFNELVEICRHAPSWKNTQTIRYVIVKDRKIIDNIKDNCVLDFEYNAKTLAQCSALVVITQVNGRCGYERDGSFSTSKGSGWEMFDAGIAAQTFCLAAYEKGIGSCIQGIFDDAKVAEAIGLEEGRSVAALIPVGIPKFTPEATPRKEVSELISFR